MATIKEVTRVDVCKARQDFTNISKMPVLYAFRYFDVGCNPMGIYGSLPVEMFHACLLGFLNYGLEAVFSHIQCWKELELWRQRRYKVGARGHLNLRPITTKFIESMVKTDQAEFERRVKTVKEVGSRQSDLDVPTNPSAMAYLFYQDLLVQNILDLPC
jgi:hypothetical protein